MAVKGITISVVNETKQRCLSQAHAEKVLKVLLGSLVKQPKISLKIVSWGHITCTFQAPAVMRRLNKQTRKKTYVPNVLTFSYRHQYAMGDIYICPSEVKKQAKGFGLTFHQTLTFMLVHGLLHLFEFDHDTTSQTKKMELTEEHITSQVYA